MATSKIYGTAVTNKYNNKNYTWKDWTWITDTQTDTTCSLTFNVKFCLTSHGSGSNISLSKGNFSASLTVDGSQRASFTSTADHKLYGGEANAWNVITYTYPTITKTHTTQTVTWSSWCKGVSPSTWKGTSTISTQTFTVPALASYTVSYNANDGTGTIADDTKWFGEDLTLSDGSGFTRTNYTLVGWNTAADGSGTSYSLSGVYDVNSGTTLYAQWELSAVQMRTKVSGTWYLATAYYKINGSWIMPHTGYVKVNGTWIPISNE